MRVKASAELAGQALLYYLLRTQRRVGVVDLQIDKLSAGKRFEQFQWQACGPLAARSILKQSSSIVKPVLLPFWQFDASVAVEALGHLGYPIDRSNPNSATIWRPMEDWATICEQDEVPRSEHYMQVHASYKYSPSLVSGCKPSGVTAPVRPLVLHEAESLEVKAGPTQEIVELQPPDMRQAIGWQLAFRGLKKAQIERAANVLKERYGAVEVRDLKLNIKVRSRSARLVYYPAFVADYNYGLKYTAGWVIVPQPFKALVPGTQEGGRIVAEKHVSPKKVQALVASAVGGTGCLLGPLWGPDPLLQLGFVDVAFWAFLAVISAGVVVRSMPYARRNKHQQEQVKLERVFLRAYAQAQTIAMDQNKGLVDEHTAWLWMDADWRKWEEEEPWNWDEEHRRKWAEDLFQQQMQRVIERAKFQQKLEEERLKAEDEWQRLERRQRQFAGQQQQQQHHHAGHSGRTAHGHGHAQGHGHGHGRRRRDFLGYYKLLGLHMEEHVDANSIKSAFKKVAMQLHPDRHIDEDVAGKKKLEAKFAKVQTAYEVLKDPERRRLYDRGQLVQ